MSNLIDKLQKHRFVPDERKIKEKGGDSKWQGD